MPGGVMDDSDAGLVEAWRGGDREAGRRLFVRHYAGVARFFRNKVGEAGTDLIQRTFLACLEGRERFRHEASFRSYLFSIAYKVLCKHFRELRRDLQRREGPAVDFEEMSAYQLTSPLSEVAARQEQRLLLEGLRRLPVDYQVVLELHYWEDMDIAELAKIFETNAQSMRARLYRARNALREQVLVLAPKSALQNDDTLDAWVQQQEKVARPRHNEAGAGSIPP